MASQLGTTARDAPLRPRLPNATRGSAKLRPGRRYPRPHARCAGGRRWPGRAVATIAFRHPGNPNAEGHPGFPRSPRPCPRESKQGTHCQRANPLTHLVRHDRGHATHRGTAPRRRPRRPPQPGRSRRRQRQDLGDRGQGRVAHQARATGAHPSCCSWPSHATPATRCSSGSASASAQPRRAARR